MFFRKETGFGYLKISQFRSDFKKYVLTYCKTLRDCFKVLSKLFEIFISYGQTKILGKYFIFFMFKCVNKYQKLRKFYLKMIYFNEKKLLHS